jgi:DNA-nicking Smr family endonuclease
MSQTRRARTGKPRGLSAEDQALWDQVSRSVERLPLNSRHNPAIEADDAMTTAELQHLIASLPDAPRQRPAKSARAVDKPKPPPPKPPVAPPPSPVDLERRTLRRIASGRVEIDARLDLHGMTQAEAHRALRSFIRGCHDRDRRLVLVITGKGASGFDTMSQFGERGVLKRNVPHWLAEPGLRDVVVGFTEAGPRHGGAGALYVQLRARAQRR